jgi:hypothetical protein
MGKEDNKSSLTKKKRQSMVQPKIHNLNRVVVQNMIEKPILNKPLHDRS